MTDNVDIYSGKKSEFIGIAEYDCGLVSSWSFFAFIKESLISSEDYISCSPAHFVIQKNWGLKLREFCGTSSISPGWLAYGDEPATLSFGILISNQEWKETSWYGSFWESVYKERSGDRFNLPVAIKHCGNVKIIVLQEMISWSLGRDNVIAHKTLKRHSSNKHRSTLKSFCKLMELTYSEPTWIAFDRS